MKFIDIVLRDSPLSGDPNEAFTPLTYTLHKHSIPDAIVILVIVVTIMTRIVTIEDYIQSLIRDASPQRILAYSSDNKSSRAKNFIVKCKPRF